MYDYTSFTGNTAQKITIVVFTLIGILLISFGNMS